MTYNDQWLPATVVTLGVLRLKYLALGGFLVLLVSLILSIWIGLHIMWPYALFGALSWAAFGTAYRKNVLAVDGGDPEDWKTL